jgi:hypothetical protein
MGSVRSYGSKKDYGLPSSLEEEAKAAAVTEGDEKQQRHFAKLKEWLGQERDRQAENRYQMALDEDFYDGLQWSEDDAKTVEERGQAPLVYNETKVSMDWIIGSEKRNRTDWKVLPRTEDDVTGAEVKTKVMKYVADVNHVPYVRSAAFKDQVVAGLGWIEDSVSPDATKDVLYCGYESWRNILHDSFDRSIDGSGMRYVFRWRDLDVDVACAMFPGQEGKIWRAAKGEDELLLEDESALWYMGSPLRDRNEPSIGRRGVIPDAVRNTFNSRQRVRLYECWYKVPSKAKVLKGGSVDGEVFDESNRAHTVAIENGSAFVVPSTTMLVRCSYFLADCLLDDFQSPFKHSSFPFTPFFGFRRARDGMPYGAVRNMRDPQEDLNKRMSKALFLLSVNQVITEVGAFDEQGEYTISDAIDAVSRPNGVIVMRDGQKRFEIRRDYNELQGQTELVSMDRQFLQSASGVTDELLGRRTNATSGVAIAARQDQGSLTTSGLFDNYRLSMMLSGQKQLSNAEKFYTLPKVIRLTAPKKGAFEWVKINQPEVQPDGSVRFMNDISASSADFIVDEQDFKASMRQAMFDSLNDMIGKIAPLNPTFAISMLDLLIDVADFPGKEEMLERVRQLIAEARGEGPKDPALAAAEAEAAELQKRAAAAKIAKDEASADKADAEADAIRVTLRPDMVALDLERKGLDNVAQQQAVTGTAPIPQADQAKMAQASEFKQADLAAQGIQPAQSTTAPASGVIPEQPAALAPGVAASSAPLPAAAGPDISTLLAQIVATQQQLADVAAGVAAGLDGVANAVEGSQKNADGAAAALDAVAGAVEENSKNIASVAKATAEAVQAAKQSTAEVAKALAEGKQSKGKTIEVVGKDGKKMTATIKPN